MNVPDIVAKAIFFIEGDETASWYQASIVSYESSLWLVANWLESNDTGKRYPAQLIPLERLPHVVRKDGLFQLGTLIPRELLSYPIPPELQLSYGAVDAPGLVHIPGPGPTH